MADEITLQASLTLQRSTLSLQGVGAAAANSVNGNGVLNVQKAATGGIEIEIGNVSFATAGFLFVKNLDTSIVIELGVHISGTTYYFSKLRKQEFCLIPVEPSGVYYVKSASGTPFFQVGAVAAE